VAYGRRNRTGTPPSSVASNVPGFALPLGFSVIANATIWSSTGVPCRAGDSPGNFQTSRAIKNDGRRTIVRKHSSALAECSVLWFCLWRRRAPSQADLSAIIRSKKKASPIRKECEIMSYMDRPCYGPRLNNRRTIKEAPLDHRRMKTVAVATVHLEQWGDPLVAAGSNGVFRQVISLAGPDRLSQSMTPGTKVR